MEDITFLTFPIIVGLVYMIVEVLKVAFPTDKFKRFIPLVAIGLGMVFGIVGFYLAPNLHIAGDVLSAIFVGVCSGLGATGTHQVFKQLGNSTAKTDKE